MQTIDKEYLAKRLAEARSGARRPKVLGYSTKKKKCENCGKENLSRTIEIQFPNGKISYFGSECANRFKSISYMPSRKKDMSEDIEENIEDSEDLEDSEEELNEEDSVEEDDLNEDPEDDEEESEEEVDSYLEKDSPELYEPEYSGGYSTEYLSDPLPTFELDPSIENFDKRFQIKDIVFDCSKGKASIGHSSNIRNVGFAAMMKPSVFLKLAATLDNHFQESIKILEDSKMVPGWGPPTLYVDFDNKSVNGHEGRHRTFLFKKWYPNDEILVHFIVRNKDFYIKKDLTLDDLKTISKGLFNEDYSLLKESLKTDHAKKKGFVKNIFEKVFFDRNGRRFEGKI